MPRTIDAPHWQKALHFNQCYAVILLARERGNIQIISVYSEWIVRRLGSPYDMMLLWAAENGFPAVEAVWAYGWR